MNVKDHLSQLISTKAKVKRYFWGINLNFRVNGSFVQFSCFCSFCFFGDSPMDTPGTLRARKARETHEEGVGGVFTFLIFLSLSIRNPPAWHRGLPGPWGPEPQKSPKRVREGVPGPPAPASPRMPKERPGLPKESKKATSDFFWTPGRTLWAFWGSPGPEAPDTFSDSFRTLLGFRARRAREPSVPGRGSPNPCSSSSFLEHSLTVHSFSSHLLPLRQVRRGTKSLRACGYKRFM